MTTTRPPDDVPTDAPAPEGSHWWTPTDHSRTGAVWVTATGAFLLFAAAAVFIAVQWNHLDDRVKLGILSTLTGTCLLAGRRVRDALPATAGVIYHLGAFLIPVNVAAVLVNEHVSWERFLLVQGLTATFAWTALDQVEHSKVLRWAAGGAGVVLAAGLAATTGAPAPLVLAVGAVVAEVLRRRGEAVGWSIVAGTAPLLALAERALPFGTGVLTSLGLAGDAPQRLALVSGVVAALVLGRNAQRRQDLLLVVLAFVSGAIGVTWCWVGFAPGRGFDIVGVASLFLVAELTAGAVRRDPFWSRPAHALAVAAEGITAVVTPLGLLASLWILAFEHTPRLAWPELVAGVVVATGWFVADLRRRERDTTGLGLGLLLGGGWLPSTLGLTSALAIGVITGTHSSTVAAVVAVAVAAAVVLAGRPLGHGIAAALAAAAASVAGLEPNVRAAIAMAGALVVACAAVIRAHLADREDNEPLAWLLAGAATVPIAAAHLLLRPEVERLPLLLGTIGALWVVGVVLDLGDDDAGAAFLGAPARAAAVTAVLLSPDLASADLAWCAALVATSAVVDALRRRHAWPLLALPVVVPVGVGAGARAFELSVGDTGVALCVLAAVAAGIHLLLDGDWRWPILGVVLASATSGFGLAGTSLPAASTALIILGAVGLAYSAVHHAPEGFAFSGLGITAGIWGHLANGHVVALDAYLAPVAVLLVVAGVRARTGRVSSWVAYGPAILSLGGSALLERVDGGGGVHAIVAGAVGIAAVLAGGSRRLAAPLLLGTGLLVGLTAHESLGVTRAVPTWGWLALGGTVLVLAGIAMERLDTGPVETGRRAVDIVGQNFS